MFCWNIFCQNAHDFDDHTIRAYISRFVGSLQYASNPKFWKDNPVASLQGASVQKNVRLDKISSLIDLRGVTSNAQLVYVSFACACSTDCFLDCLLSWLVACSVDCFLDCLLVSWLIAFLIGCLFDWLLSWLLAFLIDCFLDCLLVRLIAFLIGWLNLLYHRH